MSRIFRKPSRSMALGLFGIGLLVSIFGVGMAVWHYPGPFDWVYTVLSHLASLNRNPEGGRWISGSLLLASVLLWPISTYMGNAYARTGVRPVAAVWILRTGLLAAVVLSVEGLFNLRFSDALYKAHEAVALVAFLGFYLGILAFHCFRIRSDWRYVYPALVVILPLCAVGFAQLYLFFGPHDLGWVHPGWRDWGIPFYLSFAFWQWVAVFSLVTSLGHLILAAPKRSGEETPTLG